MVEIRLTETSNLVGVDMVRWLLALSSIWYFFVNPSFPLNEICQNDKFVENIKCENIECCCDYVLATHAHAWPLFPRWTSTSMQKFDKNILFAPALLSPWPQECQNMLLERKVNTFAKSQPPKHLRLKGCWCNLHHASGHVDFDGHIQKVIKCTSRLEICQNYATAVFEAK